MEPIDLVTGSEAAEILGVAQSTVSRWTDERLRPEERKLIPYARLRGERGYMLFLRSDVEALRERLAAEQEEAKSA